VFTQTTPATTFQTPSLIACFRPGTTIPKTVTLEEDRHSCFAISSLAWQAFVHHDLGNLQPEPLRQFFNAHGQPLKLKAGASTIELPRRAKTLLQRTSPG
jgi:hypothetical protein